MRNRTLQRSERGQSMVEFALTSLLFIGLLVSIIEMARFMHAYLTLQHAARTAARYAITGQWETDFATDHLAGWQDGSTDPEQQIAPCWPLFHDDPIPEARTPNGPAYYQPYRGPRTCTVEARALGQMRSLKLDPNASPEQPRYYEVVVSSRVSDITPTQGTFRRGAPGYEETRQYSSYYTDTNATPGLVRGYAGGPQQKVVIQIQYNLPIILPLLSRAIEYVPVRATVIMVNESFGSTGNLTEASSAPLPLAVDPLHIPVPPDLTVVEITRNTTTPKVGQAIVFNYTIRNLGDLNISTGQTSDSANSCTDSDPATPSTGFCLTFYLVATSADGSGPAPTQEMFQTALLPTDPGYSDAAVRVAKDINGKPVSVYFPDLQAGQSASGSVSIYIHKPKKYRIYAFVDSGQNVDEAGQGSVRDERREDNNIADAGAVSIGNRVDLEVIASCPGTFPAGVPINCTLRVNNKDLDDEEDQYTVPGVNVQLMLLSDNPDDEDAKLSCADDEDCPTWLTSVPPAGIETTVQLTATAPGDYTVKAFYQFTGSASDYYEDDSTKENDSHEIAITAQ